MAVTLEPQSQKTFIGHVCQAKIQINLRMREVWQQSSLGSFWTAKDVKCLHEENENSDRTTSGAESDLSLCRMHTSEGTFADDAAYLSSRE